MGFFYCVVIMFLFPFLFPIINFFLNSFLGGLLSRNFLYYLTIINILCMVVASFLVWLQILDGGIVILTGSAWIHLGGFTVNWGFLFDNLSSIMLFTVGFISGLVHIFSLEYMADDLSQSRFISFLSLFTLTMFIFIASDNLLQMFFGWEGIGICSYLLINFWHMRLEANTSALKAVIINRIGDGAILFSILLAYNLFHSVNYFTIFSIVPLYIEKFNSIFDNIFMFDFFYFFANIIYLQSDLGMMSSLFLNDFLQYFFLIFFLIIGSLCKSAQFFFHTWLPDAMEGPTPVSALIHAATMVTAGIFLIIRFSPIIEYLFIFKLFLGFFGALTSFFAGTCGLFQYDIKKVIAYSTCSQLGYMLFACSLSAYNLAIFHLLSHAYFKALLFLSAGSAIHALSGEQDIRKMGNLIKYLPMTYLGLLIGSFSLMGFPFLSGFFTKDLILETTLCNTGYFFFFYTIFIYGALCCTLCYSIRLLYFIFCPFFFRESSVILILLQESSSLINFVLCCLSFGSIFWGFLFFDYFHFSGLLLHVLILPFNFFQFEGDLVPIYLKMLPLVFSLFFLFTFFLIQQISTILFSLFFNKNTLISRTTFVQSIQSFIFFFSIKKWGFDELFSLFTYRFLIFFQLIFFRIIDRGLLEFLFINFHLYYLNRISSSIVRVQSGILLDYFLIFLFFSVLILFEFYNFNWLIVIRLPLT